MRYIGCVLKSNGPTVDIILRSRGEIYPRTQGSEKTGFNNLGDLGGSIGAWINAQGPLEQIIPEAS